MKLEQEVLEVERSTAFREQNFTIAGNAKAFDILSSKIYTDVPLAIVRELSTNASDSHTDAGCASRPFDVHLPNMLEPWLTIRDYGTGLSPEDVETVYTTYFKSTRSNSDEFTGCLGLGSKSPFAYTDQFTIVSNWNGKKYTYSAFKNESNCPSLALLSTVETDDHNGLEIRIAIRPNDGTTFVRAAQRVYQYFNVRPNITGATLSFMDDGKAVAKTPHFALFEHDDMRNLHSKINVVMGQVCYAVASDKIDSDLGYGAAIILNMPIGACQIAASREEIHYDARTIERIEKAIQEAIKIAKVDLEKSVASEPYLLMKLCKINKYRNIIRNLSVNGVAHIDYNEKGKYAIKDVALRRGDKLFIHNSYSVFHGGDYAETSYFVEEDVQDMTQNMKNRLRAFVKSSQGRCFLAKIEDQARFTELFGPVATKMSLLPDVPRAPRNNSRVSARSKPIKILRDDSNGNLNFDWENINDAKDIDPTDACCVPRDGNWVVWNGQRVRPSEIRKMAEALGFERVYGIAEKRYDTSRVKYKIPELSVVAKKKTEDLIASLDMHTLCKFSQESFDVSHRFDYKKLSGLSPECDNFIKTASADTRNVNLYKHLAETFGVKMPVATNYIEVFYKKYPILLAIDWYGGKINMSTVVDYIKLIENQ